jgi:antitoxin (DNA-binding transcriptional repressor) of toxin-antitoxin stability system
MHQVDLKESETQLAELIEEVANGEEVIITRSDGISFRIMPRDDAFKNYPTTLLW